MATPSLDELQARLSSLYLHYSRLRTRWANDELYYTGDFDVALPDGVNKIVPGTGRNAVEIPQTHIVTDKPLVTREKARKKGGSPARDPMDDDLVEAFLSSFMYINESSAETPPLHEAVKFLLLRGEAFLFGPFLNIEKLENGEPDWLWYDTYDPANIIADPGNNPRNVFIVEVLTVAEMLEKVQEEPWLDSYSPNGRGSADYVTLVRWYGLIDGDDVSYRAAWEGAYQPSAGSDGTNIILTDISAAVSAEWITPPEPTGYRYVPFTRCYSGYGFRSKDPERQSVPILNNQVKSLLEGECYALSVMDAYMGIATFRRYQTDNVADMDAAVIDPAPASISYVPKSITLVQQESLPEALVMNYQNIRIALQEALFSGVVAGQMPSGIRSASGLAILSGQARLKFGPPLRLLQAAVNRMLYHVGVLLADNRDLGPFVINGKELDPKLYHGDYTVKCKLLVEDAEEQDKRIAHGMQLYDKVSRRTISERYFGIEDWDAEVEEMMYESLIFGESMKATLEQFLRLQQVESQVASQDSAPAKPGLESVRVLNAAARLMRSNRPGGLPQQQALPGSVEAAANVQSTTAGVGQPPSRGGMGG